MRPRVLLGLLGLLLPALAAVPVGTANADPSGGRSTAVAAQALAQARALFDRPAGLERRTTGAPAARWSTGAPAARRDATGVLRDLALRLRDLSPDDQLIARRILARPTDQSADPRGFGYSTAEHAPYCTDHFCVHWVTTTADAPDLTDSSVPADDVPDQVELTASTFEDVWAAEVGAMGYAAPRSDGTVGGDTDKFDVYLVDSGTRGHGVYGYCSPDVKVSTLGQRLAGYCGVDNDFAEFKAAAPLASLQVTAAHEFFHAVQFGYDAADDWWFMESTAAWMEDEVYDDINDNYQYLGLSPLSEPRAPLDFFEGNDIDDDGYTYPQYGSWVFWKLLSETYGRNAVRDVWTKAVGPRSYSLSALRSVLGQHRTDLVTFFARFGAVNRYPGQVYSEGRAYPAARLFKTMTLTRRTPGTKAMHRALLHLSNQTFRYQAGSTLTGKRKLRVTVDMPPRYRGSAATVVVHFRDGRISRRPVRLDRSGAGHLTVPFSRSQVRGVELTLTNASSRYDCWHLNLASGYKKSCYGIPKDDMLKSSFSAKAIR